MNDAEDLQGSSRTSGATSRGRGYGSAPNMADIISEQRGKKKAVMGRVKVYNADTPKDLDPDKTRPSYNLDIQVCDDVRDTLETIASKLSQPKKGKSVFLTLHNILVYLFTRVRDLFL